MPGLRLVARISSREDKNSGDGETDGEEGGEVDVVDDPRR